MNNKNFQEKLKTTKLKGDIIRIGAQYEMTNRDKAYMKESPQMVQEYIGKRLSDGIAKQVLEHVEIKEKRNEINNSMIYTMDFYMAMPKAPTFKTEPMNQNKNDILFMLDSLISDQGRVATYVMAKDLKERIIKGEIEIN